MQLVNSLARVEVNISTACSDTSRIGAWGYLREFGKWDTFFKVFDGRPIQSSTVAGDQDYQIGARRMLQVGAGKLVEQLTALDEENKTLSYKLITHPANLNPFSASFVNYTCRVRVRPITMIQQSFIEMDVSFMTEPAAMEAMQSSLVYFHESCLQSLCHCLGHKSNLEPARSMPQIGASISPIGSYDLYSTQPGLASMHKSMKFTELSIGRQPSAQLSEIYRNTDRQNSSDSNRSHLETSNVLL